MGLLALLATAVAVVGLLFGERVRYILHDFHHLFPRGLGRWQSIAVAVAVLAMPVLLGLGVVPVLLVLFARGGALPHGDRSGRWRRCCWCWWG